MMALVAGQCVGASVTIFAYRKAARAVNKKSSSESWRAGKVSTKQHSSEKGGRRGTYP